MPLPVLVAACGDEAPADVRAAARALRHVSVRCVNLGVGRENLTDKHWIYYPEDTVFHRIFVQGNASPYCNPPGGFGLTCEITYSRRQAAAVDGDGLIERCIAGTASGSACCARTIGSSRPTRSTCRIAYVVYDHERAQNVELIRDWLARARHHPRRPLQRVGVLQLRPRVRRRPQGGRAGARRGTRGRQGGRRLGPLQLAAVCGPARRGRTAADPAGAATTAEAGPCPHVVSGMRVAIETLRACVQMRAR